MAYGTRNDTLLKSVPPGVITLTSPVVAPVGTVVVISELETTVNLVAVPLKVTLVAPVRSVPRMLMAAPTTPEPCRGFTAAGILCEPPVDPTLVPECKNPGNRPITGPASAVVAAVQLSDLGYSGDRRSPL